ncbi:MAG: hypothetical protein IPL61_29960 [Myxococcales bacterium]|nr:hypothetical protein [Myxococcales bacterium]
MSPDEPKFLGAPPPGPVERPTPSAPPARGPEIHALAVSGADRVLAAGLATGVVEAWMPGLLPGFTAPFLRGQGHTGAVRALAFCPIDPVGADGAYHLLASGSVDGTVRTWHLGDPGRDQALTHHEASVLAVAWSPDGALLATGSEDESIALVGSDGTVRRRRAHAGSVLALGFAPDGARYASGGYDGHLRVWSTDDDRLLADLAVGDAVWALAFTPDGDIVYACGRAAGWWRPGTGADRRWRDPLARPTARCYTAAVRPGGLATSFGGDVALIDVAAAEPRLRRAHAAPVSALANLRDGRLASGDEAGRLCIWAADDQAGEPLAQLRAGP